jgi:prepilin-type N-terminal cleavage/methylation domain
MNNNKGFTLVEIIVTLAIAMIMTTIIYVAINSTQWSATGIERKVTAQQDEKAALSVMEMEIRMASYNPLFIADNLLWRNADCSAPPSANPAYKGIQEATANSITIQMDINDNGAITATPADPNEIIRYNYDKDLADRYITRETNCGGAQPFLGAKGGTTTVKTVNVINDELGIPVFRYFDGSGAEIAAANLPGLIPQIRRIMITLAVETEYADPATKQRRRMIYSSSVIVRNHAPAL